MKVQTYLFVFNYDISGRLLFLMKTNMLIFFILFQFLIYFPHFSFAFLCFSTIFFSVFRYWTGFVVDPSDTFYYRWLLFVSCAVMYNVLFIISRSVFWELQDGYLPLWLTLDYLSDIMYIMDMFVSSRTGTGRLFFFYFSQKDGCTNVWKKNNLSSTLHRFVQISL